MFDADIYVLSYELPLSKDDFMGYISLLKLICDLTEKHQRNDMHLISELSTQINRKLSQLEEEVVYCFINGL